MKLPLVVALSAALLAGACSSPDTSSSSRWTPARNASPDGEKLPLSVPSGHTGPFTSWWGPDRPREIGEYVGGRRHGEVVAFYADGSIQLQGHFEHGRPVGDVVHHYEGGAGPALQQSVANGKLDGPSRTFDEQGNLRSLVHHRAGELHGEETRWHPNGRLEAVGLWDRGRKVGLWQHFDAEGRLVSDELFVDDGARTVASLETVYDGAGRAVSQDHRRREDGRWVSVLTTWHDSGRQAGLVESVDGRRHGRDVTWGEDGRPLIVGARRDDLRQGTWTFFTRDGRVDRQVRYEAGEEVGGR